MLRLENVNKTFGGNLTLKDITTTFENNQTTVLVGPSGSGSQQCYAHWIYLRCLKVEILFWWFRVGF